MKNVKNYKNLFALLIVAIIFALVFGGCGSSEGMFDYAYNAIGSKANYDYEGAEVYRDSGVVSSNVSGGNYKLTLTAAEVNESSAPSLPADRKIIRDANVTVEVENVEKSYENILARLAEFGGYKANDSMENYGENNIRIEATLKIPYKKLDDFITELKKEGNVKNSSTTSKDITEQYYDAEIRLETLEKSLENYFRFLENAKNVEEQLQVTSYINDITYQIEQVKGSLNLWKALVDYSTVTLHLYEPYQAPAEVRELTWDSLTIDDMGWFISSGFLSVINAIFSMFQWILIIIAVISPILIPGLIVLFVLLHRHKKKKKQRQEMQMNNNSPVENITDNNHIPH